MNVYRLIKIGLVVAVLILVYALYRSILDPIQEAKEKAVRRQAVIERLSKARDAEMAYRALYGKFAGRWDDLLNMARHDSFVVVKTIGDPDDTTKPVFYDTTLIAVSDSLFADFPIDSLPYVPYSGGDTFLIAADKIKVRGVWVNVFQISEPEHVAVDPSRPLQVGSLLEPTYSGNW